MRVLVKWIEKGRPVSDIIPVRWIVDMDERQFLYPKCGKRKTLLCQLSLELIVNSLVIL